MPPFANPPLLFFCSIRMGKNRQTALIAGEVLKCWTDLLQSSWALRKADPPLQTPVTGAGGQPCSGYTLVSNYAPLGWLHYKWAERFSPLALFQSQNPPSSWFTDEDKGGVKVASFTGGTAPGPLSHTAIAAAETCSWPSITVTRNTGLWDLR